MSRSLFCSSLQQRSPEFCKRLRKGPFFVVEEQMLILLILTFGLGAFAEEVAPISARASSTAVVSCVANLESNAQFKTRVSSGALISGLLMERGQALGATKIGLIEVWMKNGETMISGVHFKTDNSSPVSEAHVKAFMSRVSRRVHLVERVNVWELDIASGNVRVHSMAQ